MLTMWDFRFGQLIENILNDGNKRFLSVNQVKLLSTSAWIDMVNTIDFGGTSGEYCGLDPRRDPKRIPIAMSLIKAEWMESLLPFGQYLLDRKEREYPGGTLYGDEIEVKEN
ncbi:hypothetical protein ACFPOG_12580 [Paenibacillus aestuarii]|uniref:Tn3 transposase DDE domain-containing protein n=1 Tax=Paenibacillus aestuarii TaxID=516965 RepID=A0ABW0K6U9_9BACL